MIKKVVLFIIAAVFLSSCRPPTPPQTAAAVVTQNCGPRPASWGLSEMRLALGSPDTALDNLTGALIVDISLDSVPPVNKAQISLLHGASHQDVIYGDSAMRISAPAGRYVFRARMLGAQTVQDSIDLRGGFADTVKVKLAREVVCLLSRVPTT
jgi:hypothetical protein